MSIVPMDSMRHDGASAMPLRYPHVAARIFNTPLLIHPGKLDAIITGLSPRFGIDAAALAPQAMTVAEGEWRKPGYEIINGIARLGVMGVLTHRGSLEMDTSSYLLGYRDVARSMEAALADNAVRAIMLEFDSPGGEVAGLFDLAAMIRRADAIKPVHAVSSDAAYSAAYAMACCARELSITRTGGAGSIGVVMRHVDFSRMLSKEGFAITQIFAGRHKVDGNPYEPLPTAVRDKFQSEIDVLYQMFVDLVAETRGLEVAAVRGTEADVFMGQAAIDAGLADRIETPDELLNRLASMYGAGQSLTAASGRKSGERAMSNDTQSPVAEQAATYTEEQLQAAVATARDEGYAAGVVDGNASGRVAERQRIAAIEGSDAAKTHPALAHRLAMTTPMSVDEAVACMADLPPEQASHAAASNQFAAHMTALGNPPIQPDAEGGADDVEAAVSNIVAMTRGHSNR